MALFSKAIPKAYPELCAVYLPRAIDDNVELCKALEVIDRGFPPRGGSLLTSIRTMFVGPIMGIPRLQPPHIPLHLVPWLRPDRAGCCWPALSSTASSWLWAARITTVHRSDLPVIVLD